MKGFSHRFSHSNLLFQFWCYTKLWHKREHPLLWSNLCSFFFLNLSRNIGHLTERNVLRLSVLDLFLPLSVYLLRLSVWFVSFIVAHPFIYLLQFFFPFLALADMESNKKKKMIYNDHCLLSFELNTFCCWHCSQQPINHSQDCLILH